MNELIELLKQKQGNESDYIYAGSLGVSQQLWQMTRSRKREIGMTLLKAVSKAHPELAVEVLIFLGWDIRVLTKLLGDIPTGYETPRNSKLRRLQDRLRSYFTKQ